jgi:hypothetical protein
MERMAHVASMSRHFLNQTLITPYCELRRDGGGVRRKAGNHQARVLAKKLPPQGNRRITIALSFCAAQHNS